MSQTKHNERDQVVSQLLIHLEADKDESLQSQLRRQFVDKILSGALPPGHKLPSSRKLSQLLKVSRNTVVLTYQALTEEGFIDSRERSGLFVSQQVQQGRKIVPHKTSNIAHEASLNDRTGHFPGAVATTNQNSQPQNWRDFSFPFVDGMFDISLYPVKELKDANARANASDEICQWSQLAHDCDDPMLLREIQTKILPRRGISATSDEILITAGSQQALFLVIELLVSSHSCVALEEPGFPETRDLVRRKGARTIHQPLDLEGMIIDERLQEADVLYTTPSHQTPTSVTMSQQRREALLSFARQHDQFVIEDDFEFESNFLGQPHPALRSLDTSNRVIYLSCLSKVLAAGLQISFVVADASIIAELRKLRKYVARTPSLNNQRTAAYFLSLGYYDGFMMLCHKTIYARWLELREALNIYLPNCIHTGPILGGSAYWITGPEQLDDANLMDAAAERGILLEPVKKYFAASQAPKNVFRMGVTSITVDKIQAGVKKLAELIHGLVADHEENLTNAKGRLLSQADLKKLLPGITMSCEMVYGVPCEIRLLKNGQMLGETGGYDKEFDRGKWWIENGMYFRKWDLWGYGETNGYYVIVDGSEMKWFDANYRFVRKLTILPD